MNQDHQTVSRKKKIVPWLLIVFIIIILAGIGFLIWRQFGIGKNAETSFSTSSWQTYENNVCGYSIKYPKDWIVNSNNYRMVLMLPEKEEESLNARDFRADIYINCDNFQAKTLSELADDLQNKNESTFSGVKVFDGTMMSFSGAIQAKAFSNNNHLYRVEYSASDVTTKILSTFKFIN